MTVGCFHLARKGTSFVRLCRLFCQFSFIIDVFFLFFGVFDAVVCKKEEHFGLAESSWQTGGKKKIGLTGWKAQKNNVTLRTAS
ncbi:MAG: hypothetical protein K6B45_00055 [Bacteroidaceae bacterium]|nr:hypothetical protein [Bacteroidaceae bacterium]